MRPSPQQGLVRQPLRRISLRPFSHRRPAQPDLAQKPLPPLHRTFAPGGKLWDDSKTIHADPAFVRARFDACAMACNKPICELRAPAPYLRIGDQVFVDCPGTPQRTLGMIVAYIGQTYAIRLRQPPYDLIVREDWQVKLVRACPDIECGERPEIMGAAADLNFWNYASLNNLDNRVTDADRENINLTIVSFLIGDDLIHHEKMAMLLRQMNHYERNMNMSWVIDGGVYISEDHARGSRQGQRPM